ncbi:hypothetical protein GX586_05555, partial [bacterium]|nr:hypothetical protein [bacterium]
ANDVWDNGARWSPAGAPSAGDDAVVTSGWAVVLTADGICKSLDISGAGWAIINNASHKLTVSNDARVSGSGNQLRANVGLCDVGGVITATNGGAVCVDGGTFKAGDLTFGTGTLIWHSGTIQLSDRIWVANGSGWQGRRIVAGQTLDLYGSASGSGEIWMDDYGVFTLDGGTIDCNGVWFTASSTFNFHDGTLNCNGADFIWGASNVLVQSDTPAHHPRLTLNGYYFPQLTYGMLLATSDHSRASLVLTGSTRLSGNATIAGGAGSLADVLLTASEWQPTTCTLGGSGTASLIITNNSRADSCQELHIARYAGSTGTLYLTHNASWSSYWKTYVGEYGVANVTARRGSTIEFGGPIQDPLFADHAGSEANLLITDPGSSFTLSAGGNPQTICLGYSGAAHLVLSNGATSSFADHTRAGYNQGSRGDVIVTGHGSKWHVTDDVWLGYEGIGTLQVLDGATTIWDCGKLGEFPHGNGSVLVSGNGSYFNGGGYEVIGLEFLVGRYGLGQAVVSNGAMMHSSGYSELGSYDASCGKVIVTGSDSKWIAADSIVIGGTYYTHATGIVVVADGGCVSAGDGVTIGYSSVLMGHGGTMHAKVENHYGHVSPGTSVGTLTIDGTLKNGSGGEIDMEITGRLSSQYDHLVVTGLSTLAGTLDVTLDGFAPVSGDTFDLFDWVGGTTGMFGTVNLPALGTGLFWVTNNLYTAGTLHVSPEPACALMMMCTLALAPMRRYH